VLDRVRAKAFETRPPALGHVAGLTGGRASLARPGHRRAEPPTRGAPASASPRYSGLDSFMSASPLTISKAAATRDALTVSPRKTTPATNAPTAPIPVHTV